MRYSNISAWDLVKAWHQSKGDRASPEPMLTKMEEVTI